MKADALFAIWNWRPIWNVEVMFAWTLARVDRGIIGCLLVWQLWALPGVEDRWRMAELLLGSAAKRVGGGRGCVLCPSVFFCVSLRFSVRFHVEAKTADSSWVLSLAAQPRCLSDSINKTGVHAYLRLVPKVIRTNLIYLQNETHTTFPTTASLLFTRVCCCSFCGNSQRGLFKGISTFDRMQIVHTYVDVSFCKCSYFYAVLAFGRLENRFLGH